MTRIIIDSIILEIEILYKNACRNQFFATTQKEIVDYKTQMEHYEKCLVQLNDISNSSLIWDPIKLKLDREIENKENELKKQKNKEITQQVEAELRKQHYKIVNGVKKRSIFSLNLNSIRYKEKIQENKKYQIKNKSKIE